MTTIKAQSQPLDLDDLNNIIATETLRLSDLTLDCWFLQNKQLDFFVLENIVYLNQICLKDFTIKAGKVKNFINILVEISKFDFYAENLDSVASTFSKTITNSCTYLDLVNFVVDSSIFQAFNFYSLDLRYSRLRDNNFLDCYISKAKILEVKVLRNNFIKTLFRETKIFGSSFTECFFLSCNFLRAEIKSTFFYNCVFKNCSFNQANLKTATFINCKFEDCSFNLTVGNDQNIFTIQLGRFYLVFQGSELFIDHEPVVNMANADGKRTTEVRHNLFKAIDSAYSGILHNKDFEARVTIIQELYQYLSNSTYSRANELNTKKLAAAKFKFVILPYEPFDYKDDEVYLDYQEKAFTGLPSNSTKNVSSQYKISKLNFYKQYCVLEKSIQAQ
jgi:uncharacterized protein YjbI with pentapeptide repeats